MTSIMAVITKWLMISYFAIAILYNISVKIFASERDTISKVTLDGCLAHPSIAIILGFLFGHLFWPIKGMGELEYWKYSMFITIPILIFVIVLDNKHLLLNTYPILYVWLGNVIGHLGWPQRFPGS